MQIVHDYRALHTIPELDRHLPKTLSYISKALSPLGCQVFSPAKGAICAYFDFGSRSTLAFRADTDALPICEQTGLPYASRHEGVMHACGHDGHTAILLELARKVRPQSGHNILLIFQPAEETDGGAESICQTGILSKYKVRAIFGLHLWPGLPKGSIFSRSGVLMSRACGVTAEFTGRSVHIANAQQGADALNAVCRFQQQAERLRFPAPFRLKFGKVSGGTAGNILCDKAILLGSLRAFSDLDHCRLQNTLHKLCHSVSQQTGCRGDLHFTSGYPAVCNHPQLWLSVQKKCPVKQLYRAFWTADDFSFYQQQVPGVYFLLGLGDTASLHSPNFAFDEAVLSSGADFFLHLCQAL